MEASHQIHKNKNPHTGDTEYLDAESSADTETDKKKSLFSVFFLDLFDSYLYIYIYIFLPQSFFKYISVRPIY